MWWSLLIWECPNDPILLQKYLDTSGRCIPYECIVYIRLPTKKRAYFCKGMAIEMGGCIAILFSRVSRSGVDVTLLSHGVLLGNDLKQKGQETKATRFPRGGF